MVVFFDPVMLLIDSDFDSSEDEEGVVNAVLNLFPLQRNYVPTVQGFVEEIVACDTDFRSDFRGDCPQANIPTDDLVTAPRPLSPDDLISLTFDPRPWPAVTLASPLRRDQPTNEVYGEPEETFACEGEARDVTPPGRHSVGIVTDLCYSEDITEVDLITLVEEQLPRYTLRADTITSFSGYDHEDFIQTPILPSDVALDLPPELIEETLKYFILCAERLTQMTRAYNDIEAVTNLLEEKERDLELAARIGQSLLEKNKALERRNSDLDEQLTEANDKLSQLRHDLAQKEALLQVYMQEESTPETPEAERIQESLGVANIGGLMKKVKNLEDENLSLRSQSVTLKTETVLQEEKEVSLFNDCVKQLEDYKTQVFIMQDELIAKSDVNLHQQEELTTLTAKTIAQDSQIKKLIEELAETVRRHQLGQETQKELTGEIRELESQIEELEAVILEGQEEMKTLKKKQKPGFIRHHASYNSPFLPEGSLALELEDSMRKDVPCPPGYTPKERRKHNKRVMQTAKVVKKASRAPSVVSLDGSPGGSNGNESLESLVGSSIRSSFYLSEEESEAGYGGDVDSIYGSTSTLGRPGLPGSNDLETALRRLTFKKTHESHDRLGRRKRHTSRSDGGETPDSTMSNGSFSNLSDFSRMSSISSSFKIPEKLQIVKPLEGSFTLHQWKRLATPHLAGLLEHRPGVQNKGDHGNDLEEQEEIYSLSDFEEDDDLSLHLGKCMEQTSGIYTYTMSKILHPSDEYSLSTQTTTVSGSAKMSPCVASSYTSTPLASSGVSYCRMNDHGTSTFSMSAGLAAGLHERGVQDGTSQETSSRYGNIVTETISGATQSQTEILYTTAGGGGGRSTKAKYSVPGGVISREAYLHLADKVKHIGLNSILNIAKRSGIAPVTLDPVDAGLNVVMSIKRNKGAVNRCMAEKASQTIQYARYARPKIHLNKRETKRVPAEVSSTQILTNSTRVKMAAPLPISISHASKAALLKSRTSLSEEEADFLKTLPSTLVLQEASPKRPDTLSLASPELHKPKCDKLDVTYDLGHVAGVACGGQGEPSLSSCVTVSGNTISTGLLSHLTSIYTKTREIIGGPPVAASALTAPKSTS